MLQFTHIEYIRGVIFVFNMIFIFFIEYMKYIYTNDYIKFIDNITYKFSQINILYVKIFQSIALNNKLIDDVINKKLLEFTNNSPWDENSDIDINKLSDTLDKYNIKLKSNTPINSGMISLVFIGYECTNETQLVIIKIKRKNIQQKLNNAISNLLFVTKIISYFSALQKYQIAEVITKNIEIIRHQTNFTKEIINMNRIRENCKYLDYIVIPTVNEMITNEQPDIIVMEYINGKTINEIDYNDSNIFAKLVVKFGLVTTIIHGVVHGDLHSGNILFIKNIDDTPVYKLGILDFGIIYEIENKYKGTMFDIFTSVFESSPYDIAIRVLNSGIIEPENIMKKLKIEDYNNIVTICADIISNTICNTNDANQVQLYKFISELTQYLTKKELTNLGIKPSDQFVQCQMMIAMSQGVTLALCKDKFIEIMDESINELFNTNILFDK